MDKFGIFKLLSSLFENLNKNKPHESESPVKKESSATNDLLSNIENFFSSQKANTKKEEPLPAKPVSFNNNPSKTARLSNQSITPLHNQMLSTIRNHDEIVSRVISSNKKSRKP